MSVSKSAGGQEQEHSSESAKSNLDVTSNLMLRSRLTQGRRPYNFFPGDFLAEVCPPVWTDSRNIEARFTPKQLDEYRQYLACLRCRRRCNGTCSS